MTSWPRVLASPRRRRRLSVLAVALAVCGALAGTILLLRGGAPDSTEVFQRGKPVVVGKAKRIPLTTAARHGINATLERFVRDGVARRNLQAAYDLVTPNFRGGTTRAQWRNGDSPIYPYPQPTGHTSRQWRLTYSDGRDVEIALILASRHARKVGPIIFQVELVQRRGRWLVDSFGPVATFTPIGQGPQHETGPRDYAGGGVGTDISAPKAPLSAVWIAVPVAVLSLVLLVPLCFLLVSRLRARRSARAYEATLPKSLPPLPSRRS